MDSFHEGTVKKKPTKGWAFSVEEGLRKEGGRRAVVLIRVRDVIRVEPHLAVVEVEVRGVRELAVSVWNIAPAHLGHRTSRFTVLANLYPLNPEFHSAAVLRYIEDTRTRQGQAVVSSTQHALRSRNR